MTTIKLELRAEIVAGQLQMSWQPVRLSTPVGAKPAWTPVLHVNGARRRA